MPSFYFLWNPDQFRELDMNQIVQDMATGQPAAIVWNAGIRSKTPFPPGSRAFMVRTGKEPRGVFAYGSIPTGELLDDWKNWGKAQGGKVPHVEIELEKAINPDTQPEQVISLQLFKERHYPYNEWNPPASGTPIRDQTADQLRALFDARQNAGSIPTTQEMRDLDPYLEPKDLAAPEGRLLWKIHLERERNPALVKKKKRTVLRATGSLACEVCGFDFFKTYGQLGREFAECHHRTPLSLLAGIRDTRLEDLDIVCANCHRMLHRGKLTIAELQNLLEAQNLNCN
jgi:predicted HNH restriction endonuclease